MSDLNETVRKLKEMDWEGIYEQDNKRLEAVSAPFNLRVSRPENRFKWILNQIKFRFGNKKDIKIINIGSSLGVFESIISSEGYTHITGIDVDNHSIKTCRRNVPNVVFIKSTIEQIQDILQEGNEDDSKGKIDTQHVVCCTQVLEHLLEPKIAIKNMLEILKPNGLLLITVPKTNMIPSDLHRTEFDLYDMVKIMSGFGKDFKVMEIHKWSKLRNNSEPNCFAVVFNKR